MEIERIENVDEGAYHTNCKGCGEDVTLYWNGGELDSKSCCGFTYSLQSRGIDFVVEK